MTHHHHGRLHRHLSAEVRSRTTVTLVARHNDRADTSDSQVVGGRRTNAVTHDDLKQNLHRRDDVATLTATDVVTMFKVAVESGKSLVTEYTVPTLPATVSDPLYGLITVSAQPEIAVPNTNRPTEGASAKELDTIQPPSGVRNMVDAPKPSPTLEPDTGTTPLVSQPDEAPTEARTPIDESSSSTTSATSAESDSSRTSATSAGSSSSTTSETSIESDSSTTSPTSATSTSSTTQLTSTQISIPSSTRSHTVADTSHTTTSTSSNSATSISADADSTSRGGIDVGKVVGGVVGGVAGLSLVLIFIFLFIRWRRKRAVDRGIEPTARSAEMASHRSSDTPLVPGFKRWLGRSSTTRDAVAPAPGERGFQKISGRKIPPALSTGGDGYGDGVEDELVPELKGPNLDAEAASPVSPRSPAGFTRTGNGNGDRAGSDAGSSHDDDFFEESRDVVDLPPAPPAASSLSPSSSFVRPDALGRSLSRHDGSRSSRFTESI